MNLLKYLQTIDKNEQRIICTTNSQLKQSIPYIIIAYLVTLLIVVYLLVKLVNWSELTTYHYDVQSTLYATIIFVVLSGLVYSSFDISATCALDVVVSTVCAMIALRYISNVYA